MAKKPVSPTSNRQTIGEPRARSLHLPDEYGVPKKPTLLPWSHVAQKVADAKHYWIVTVTPAGSPYANPIDGVWVDERLYFGGSPKTRWMRNLASNTAVCIHLESGTDVVVLRGRAQQMHGMEHDLAVRLSHASKTKYGYAPKPEEYEKAPGIYEFKPSIVVAWSEFPKDPTRWDFDDLVEARV